MPWHPDCQYCVRTVGPCLRCWATPGCCSIRFRLIRSVRPPRTLPKLSRRALQWPGLRIHAPDIIHGNGVRLTPSPSSNGQHTHRPVPPRTKLFVLCLVFCFLFVVCFGFVLL